MKKPFFTGVCTAMVTPFIDGQVNYPMLERLLNRQLEAGIRSIVICGTTGEAPTLSDDEKIMLFQKSKEIVGTRGQIIAGTGSNSTMHAISLSLAAEKAGADGLLIVSPYYNKANEEGLYLHYKAISEAVRIPIILYNVPSRTGVDIPISVYQKLALLKNIVGVKEASTDIRKITQIRAGCPDSFSVWSGNDDMTVPTIALGGHGVISVFSNILPHKAYSMTMAALSGDFETASSLQIAYQPLIRALFSDVNPIPVKVAMKIIGMDCGDCRLPLCAMDQCKLTETIQSLLI